jgi:hypothetical protein
MMGIIAFGGVSALAALFSSEAALTPRVIVAYTMSGLIASGVVVLLLVERYGMSWFLVGIAILAGYKAVDFLAAGSLYIRKLIGKFVKNE